MARVLKRGDTFPAITGTVSDEDGPVPIGSATQVLLLLRGTTVLVQCVVTVVTPGAIRGDPNCGKWTYTWQVGDTAIAGTYAAEVQVTWSAGVIQTFPNNVPNEVVTMVQDLNETA